MKTYAILLPVLLVTMFTWGAETMRHRCRIDKTNVGLVLCDNTKPSPTFVPVMPLVPPGYASVYPSVVQVPRCQGKMCFQNGMTCMGTQTVNETFYVQAMKDNERMSTKCLAVQIPVDKACGCGCAMAATDCNANTIFNESLCKCECNPAKHRECKAKIRKHPNTYMWSHKECQCLCNNFAFHSGCTHGQTFDQESCRCI